MLAYRPPKSRIYREGSHERTRQSLPRRAHPVSL